MRKRNNLTLYIFIAMIVGAVAGYYVYAAFSVETRNHFSSNIKLLSTIFLRLVQMIIAPLVFSTLVVGIAKLGNIKTVGRVGGKAMLWFISASLMSLLLGMLLVNIFKPGSGINLSSADVSGAKDLIGKTQAFSFTKFCGACFSRKCC